MPKEANEIAVPEVVIEGEAHLGRLDPLKLAVVPTFMGIFAYVGPGILWAALAQGSGELIWWPYLTAKYGAAFLGILIPASLLQYWINLEICRYTVSTGETPITGFTRIGTWYATIIWVGFIIEYTWSGAYAAAGGLPPQQIGEAEQEACEQVIQDGEGLSRPEAGGFQVVAFCQY